MHQIRQRSLTVSSAVWIQCTNVTDGQTDKRTDTGRQQRPRLRIASHGSNLCFLIFNWFYGTNIFQLCLLFSNLQNFGPDLPLRFKLHEIWSVDSQKNN